MSQIDEKEELSETKAEHGEEDLKLVPVTESIRYRRRAQSAEKEAQMLAKELAETKSQLSQVSEELRNVHREGELAKRLAAKGAIDLETAVLVAGAKIEEDAEADMDKVIEEMKKEKQYLFGGASQGSAGNIKKTSGVKDKMQNGQAILERAAKRAATTGNRKDLQEYLKLRRSFV